MNVVGISFGDENHLRRQRKQLWRTHRCQVHTVENPHNGHCARGTQQYQKSLNNLRNGHSTISQSLNNFRNGHLTISQFFNNLKNGHLTISQSPNNFRNEHLTISQSFNNLKNGHSTISQSLNNLKSSTISWKKRKRNVGEKVPPGPGEAA